MKEIRSFPSLYLFLCFVKGLWRSHSVQSLTKGNFTGWNTEVGQNHFCSDQLHNHSHVFASVEGVVEKKKGVEPWNIFCIPVQEIFCCIQVEVEYCICISTTLFVCSVQFLWVYTIISGGKDFDAFCTEFHLQVFKSVYCFHQSWQQNSI